MGAFTEARMHLAVELGGADRQSAAADRSTVNRDLLSEPVWSTGLVRDAAARGFDFVILSDVLSGADGPTGVLDTVALASRIAAVVPGIGLVPQVTVAQIDPPALSHAVAALDLVSAGRSGWEPVVSASTTQADLLGSGQADLMWSTAGRVVDAVSRRWSSWADGAVLSGLALGGATDRGAPHPAFVWELSATSAVSPAAGSQRRPLTVIRADEFDALDVAVRFADVVRIAAPGLDAARAIRRRLRDAAVGAGRPPDDLTVLLDVEVHLAAETAAAHSSLRQLDTRHGARASSSLRVVGTAGALADLVERAVALQAADGITFLPLALPADLHTITREVVPLLASRGLVRTARAGARLRARFRPGYPARR